MHLTLKRFSLLLLFILTNAHAADPTKMIFAIDLIRHGDRTPIVAIPTVAYQWHQGLGQLTAVGMRQEFELGMRLRQHYVEKAKLLPTHYQPGTIYVRSTDFDRTLMSAQSLLMGLYPLGTGPSALPNAYQPIPIHTETLASDRLLATPVNPAMLKSYVFTTKDWQQKNVQLQKQYKRWSKATGMSITSLDQLILLADALFIYQRYHLNLPPTLSTTDIQEIMTAGQFAFTSLYKPKQIGAATGKNLLKTMVTYLQEASQQKTPLKFVLFSGHDATILSLMSALNVPLNSAPPYASDVNFALFETANKQYQVKITYNNEPVFIPACNGISCSLAQLATLIT